MSWLNYALVEKFPTVWCGESVGEMVYFLKQSRAGEVTVLPLTTEVPYTAPFKRNSGNVFPNATWEIYLSFTSPLQFQISKMPSDEDQMMSWILRLFFTRNCSWTLKIMFAFIIAPICWLYLAMTCAFLACPYPSRPSTVTGSGQRTGVSCS